MTERKGKLNALFHVRDSVLPNVKSTPLHKAVLLLLASYANPDGTSIFQSSRSIAASLGCERSTVQAALGFWKQTGVLVLVKAGNGRGHANEYRIDMKTGFMELSFETGNGVVGTPFPRGNGVKARDKGSDKRSDKRGSYATTTEVPNHRIKNTEAEEAAAAAAADTIRKAFRDLGCEEPFGDRRLQLIWAEEWNKLPPGNNGGGTDAMERTAQRCQQEGIRIPALFFQIKRRIEKLEVEHRFHRTPL